MSIDPDSITPDDLSEREKRLLIMLDIRDAELHRCAWHPEHDGDIIAGTIWHDLGVFWRPSDWELALRDDRSLQQSYSHTFRRLRKDKRLVGRNDGSDSSYYWLTKRGQGLVNRLTVPADLRRHCRYDSCGRWLPPTEPEPICHRCRFSREYRESGAYRSKGRGEGYQEFIRSGVVDIVHEGLISRDHATRGMEVAWAMHRKGEPLIDGWREWRASLSPDDLPSAECCTGDREAVSASA